MNELYRVYTDCVNASNVNMFIIFLSIFQKSGLNTDDNFLDSR